MLKAALLVGTFLLFQLASACAQVQQEWSARYNGPTNGWDSAVAVTSDPSGNVYATGPSEASAGNTDYLTVKYSPSGTLIWSARYNGPTNGKDIPAAIRVDSSGNVYVSGTSRGTNRDEIATIKYDGNSNQVWVARYNPAGLQNHSAAGMEIDAAGNVYVAGTGSNSAAFVTIKYNSSGGELWKAFYVGTNSGSVNTAAALALDSQGNVYVTGASLPLYYFGAYATIKYSTNGTQLWAARYGGPGGLNYPAGIGLDGSGNIYVTGRSEESSYQGRYDYATVKYDSTGALLWAARYNSPLGTRNDMGRGLAVSGSGNVHVTGTAAGVLADDLVTIKYLSDGGQEWVARYNGAVDGLEAAASMGIAVDGTGNVYVNGSSRGSGTNTELATIKYAANGIQRWVVRSAATISTNLTSRPVALGPTNELLVVGEMAGLSGSKDFATFKYLELASAGYPEILSPPQPLVVVQGSNATFSVSATGAGPLTYQWRFNGRTSAGATSATLLLTNVQPGQQGEYSAQVSNALGWVESPMARLTVNWITNQPRSQAVVQGSDAYFKVDVTGVGPFEYRWQFNGSDIAGATTNVLALPNVQPSDAGYYVALVSSSAGVMRSDEVRLSVLTHVRQAWADARDPGYSIALDPATNVYVTGASGGWLNASADCITARFNTEGTRQWRTVYNGPGNGFDGFNSAWSFRARLITADNVGNAYISACSKSTGGPADHDFVTIKYDTNGNPVWVARLDGNPGTEAAGSVALALDNDGNLYVTGCANSSGNGYLTVKYDTNGNQAWVANYPGSGVPTDLTVDGTGNGFIAGRNFRTVNYSSAGTQSWVAAFGDYSWALALDSQTNVFLAGSAYGSGTDYDYMTVKYDTAGNLLWSQRYPDGGLSWESAWDVAVGPQDTVYVAGSAGTVKYSPDGVRLWVSPTGGRNIKVTADGAAYVLDGSWSAATAVDYSLRKLDKDGNFLWEARYGALANDTAAALILDKAGNIYVTGSAGTVKFSEQPIPPLRLSAEASATNGLVRFSLNGPAGRFYAIQASTDFTNWTTITNVVNDAGTVSFADLEQESFPKRFYRALVDF